MLWVLDRIVYPQRTENIASIETLTIDHAQGSHVVIDPFKAEISGKQTDGTAFTTHYRGPLLVARTSHGWAVEDYIRNGRSIDDALFTELKGGSQSRSGVTVKVAMTVLGSDFTDIYITVKNDSSGTVHADFAPSLIDASGTQHSDGAISLQNDEIAPHAKVTIDCSWAAVLPLTSKRLRLVLNMSDANFNNIDMDIPVILVG